MYYFSYAYLPFFLGLTALIYFLVPLRSRWRVLLAASLIFYLYFARLLIVFILITGVTVYYSALWIEKIDCCTALAGNRLGRDERAQYKSSALWQKKAVIVLLVLINFGILATIKYFSFVVNYFIDVLKPFTGAFQQPHWHVILPLGISFYTLQAVSYVVDVYRGKVKANRSFGQVLLFLCFFPQIVEGPIGRYDHLAPQLYEGHRFDWQNFTHGLQLILWGLIKEFVIADRASILVGIVFGRYQRYSGGTVALAILLYTLQLYADFSGCIDVATGSAQILGIELAPNFQRPFFSRSVNEFWRRWHITLGAWLRDYIFYPVSLSKPLTRFSRFIRKNHNTHLGKWAAAGSALFFVWLGNGLWHGAGLKYFVYGMYYFVIMMLGLLFEPAFKKALAALHINREGAVYRVFQIVRTFVLVNIGMLIFRADNLLIAGSMFGSLFAAQPASLAAVDPSVINLGLDTKDFAVLAVSTLVLFIVGLLQEKGIRLRLTIGKWPLPARWGVYLAGVFILIIFGAYGFGYKPAAPIYAGF